MPVSHACLQAIRGGCYAPDMDEKERVLKELRLVDALNTLAALGTLSGTGDAFNRWKEWKLALAASGYARAGDTRRVPMTDKLRAEGLELLRPHRDKAAQLGCKLPVDDAA